MLLILLTLGAAAEEYGRGFVSVVGYIDIVVAGLALFAAFAGGISKAASEAR